MSHTETKEVTYLDGHRIKVGRRIYKMERTCRIVRRVDERREVAERLRMASGPSLMILMHVLGVGEDGIFDRLADLIEPSCDRDALLALADGCDISAGYEVPIKGWSEVMHSLARRIREACGEVAS